MKAALVAGEASGDLLAGLLLDGLRHSWPDLTAAGIGGAQMVQRGFVAWWPSDRLSVNGFGWDLIQRYPQIIRIRRQIRDRLLRDCPDVFIGVDAPDFNLDLEESLRANGIKTVHLVCPSVWAWRPERLDHIRRSADHVLCIFPFEPDLLSQHGIASTYVGHPLASVIPMQPDRAGARRSLGLAQHDRVVAILPGSRATEISHLALPFLQAAALVRQALPDTKFVVPAVPLYQARIESVAHAIGFADRLQVVTGRSHSVLEACDVALVASGTATLEAALFKRPLVIAYRMGGLSWQIMRRKKLQPWVGLPNILCREFVVPELIQEAVTPQALARAVMAWLDAADHQPDRIAALEQRFTALHHDLQRDTSQIAAHAIAQILSS